MNKDNDNLKKSNRRSFPALLGEWAYNSVVKRPNQTILQRIKWKIINKILKYNDPVVNVYIGQRKMKMLLSQKTPLYYAIFPYYDKALPRICKLLQKIDEKLIIIDVGANIGDTASLIAEKVSNASILCIEGNDVFLPFLYHNIKFIQNSSILVEPKYCVDVLTSNKFSIETNMGTANLSASGDAEIENIDTLDNMLNNNSIFKHANLLKIDTDGFEIMVLLGAKELLKQTHPMIFFEFTPAAYVARNQDPFYLIHLLESNGYNKALFYDNFGVPVGIYDLCNKDTLNKLIDNIDNQKVFYYDILGIHQSDEDKYLTVLNNEVNFKISD